MCNMSWLSGWHFTRIHVRIDRLCGQKYSFVLVIYTQYSTVLFILVGFRYLTEAT